MEGVIEKVIMTNQDGVVAEFNPKQIVDIPIEIATRFDEATLTISFIYLGKVYEVKGKPILKNSL